VAKSSGLRYFKPIVNTLELIVKDLEALPPAKLDEAARLIHRLKEASQDNERKTVGRPISEAVFTEAVEHVMTHHAPLMKKLAS